MRTSRRWVPAVVVVLLLAACGGGAAGGGGTNTIAALLTLSGPSAQLGEHEQDGAKARLAEINAAGGVNGRKLELRVVDDGGSPTTAVNAFNKLASDSGVLAVFGSTFGSNTLAISPIDQRDKLPLLAPNSTQSITSGGNPYLYRIVTATAQEVTFVVERFKKDHLRRIGLMSSTDALGKEGGELSKKAITSAGMTVTDHEEFNRGVTDLTPQLTRIRASAPDALYIFASAPEVGIAIKNAGQLGMSMPIFTNGAANDPSNITAAAGSPALADWRLDGQVEANLPPDQQKTYARLEKQFGYPPDAFTDAGWNAMTVLADALKRAGNNPTRASLQSALEKTRNVEVLGGTVSYSPSDHDGYRADLHWLMVENGRFVPERTS